VCGRPERFSKERGKYFLFSIRTTLATGVDVVITIFGNFSQFSAKKLAFFLNTNVMINFFHNLALFRVKNANFFAQFFGENILKIITPVPGSRHQRGYPDVLPRPTRESVHPDLLLQRGSGPQRRSGARVVVEEIRQQLPALGSHCHLAYSSHPRQK
jgi:hypothetical protein